MAKAIGTPPGPWMKDALDVVTAWQLRNPGVDDPQAAIEEVKDRQRNGELTSDLIRHFLKLTIRPLFMKATPDSVTAQGRKTATPALPKKLTVSSEDETVTKPWKGAKDAYVLSLLQWTVQHLDPRMAEECWPLLVPPILTLLDDWEVKYKRIGAEHLNNLLQITPPSLLTRTGLGEVFEEALLPCLTYIPDLTPEADSVALLSAIYPTLVTLSRTRYPKLPTASPSALDSNHDKRTKALDKILRQGIISIHSHCSNYPSIVALLFTQLATVLDEMGIDAVKHLKYVLPMLVETLSHPLSTASMQMVEATVLALQSVLRNAWPRMTLWRGEVLKGLCLCWTNLEKPGKEYDTARVREQMRETVQLLETVVESECDFRKECAMLAEADARLKDLFG